MFIKKAYTPAVIDSNIYPHNKNSYCGGSLYETNILFVCNKPDVIEDDLRTNANTENYRYKVTASLNAEKDIEKLGECLIGPFNHIVNIFYSDTNNCSVTKNGGYNQDELLCGLHQCIQLEASYLSKRSLPSTITNVFIKTCKDGIDEIITANNIEFMTKGLSRVLGNHNIICNGVTSYVGIPFDYVIKTISFACSKYGQVLAGESLKMHI